MHVLKLSFTTFSQVTATVCIWNAPPKVSLSVVLLGASRTLKRWNLMVGSQVNMLLTRQLESSPLCCLSLLPNCHEISSFLHSMSPARCLASPQDQSNRVRWPWVEVSKTLSQNKPSFPSFSFSICYSNTKLMNTVLNQQSKKLESYHWYRDHCRVSYKFHDIIKD